MPSVTPTHCPGSKSPWAQRGDEPLPEGVRRAHFPLGFRKVRELTGRVDFWELRQVPDWNKMAVEGLG